MPAMVLSPPLPLVKPAAFLCSLASWGRSYYQSLSCETQHAFSKALPFAAGPPQTSVDKSAFSTHVKFSCICCRIGCALPAVSGDLEQCCGGGSMVWHAGEAISYTKPARSDMRSGVPGINVTLSASQGCWVMSDSNQTFALVWQASVDVRKQQGHRAQGCTCAVLACNVSCTCAAQQDLVARCHPQHCHPGHILLLGRHARQHHD